MDEQDAASTSTGAVQHGDAATAPDIRYSFALFDQITGFDKYILHLCVILLQPVHWLNTYRA